MIMQKRSEYAGLLILENIESVKFMTRTQERSAKRSKERDTFFLWIWTPERIFSHIEFIRANGIIM